METWKAVPKYVGYYEVSDLGRVRSLDRQIEQVSRRGKPYQRTMKGRILQTVLDSKGSYRYAHLANVKNEHHSVHSLVLRAFIGEAPEGYEGCHGDGDSHNNVLSNLRWDTSAANQDDRKAHGTVPKGEQHSSAILTTEQVLQLKADIASFPGRKYGRIAAIAQKYGISRSHAGDIFLGKRWAHT